MEKKLIFHAWDPSQIGVFQRFNAILSVVLHFDIFWQTKAVLQHNYFAYSHRLSCSYCFLSIAVPIICSYIKSLPILPFLSPVLDVNPDCRIRD